VKALSAPQRLRSWQWEIREKFNNPLLWCRKTCNHKISGPPDSPSANEFPPPLASAASLADTGLPDFSGTS